MGLHSESSHVWIFVLSLCSDVLLKYSKWYQRETTARLGERLDAAAAVQEGHSAFTFQSIFLFFPYPSYIMSQQEGSLQTASLVRRQRLDPLTKEGVGTMLPAAID